MKELKNYIHLYLGADVQVRKVNDKDREFNTGRICEVTRKSNHGDWIMVWFDDVITVTNDTFNELKSNAHTYFIGHDEIKLILRPLSEITEDEAIEIAKIMYGQPDSIKWRMENKGDYFNVYRKHYGRSFTIDKASGDIDRYEKTDIVNEAGDRSEVSELETTLNHHIITAYMLSRGFDLFGLCDSGLAVSKTETKN